MPEENTSLEKSAHNKFVNRRKPSIETTIDKMHKLVREHLDRHEQSLFQQGKSEVLDHKQSRELKELGTLIINLGNMYIKVQQTAKHAANTMTTEEKIDAFVRFFKSAGRNTQYRLYEKVLPLFYDLEQKKNSRG
jgi:hypothetical protein